MSNFYTKSEGYKSNLNRGSFKKLILSLIVVFPLLLLTCNMPLGMGEPIDFEPPVLTIDPGPNPRFMKSNTPITGTATDNVGVTRIIATNPRGERRDQNVMINGDRWEMTLNLDNEAQGDRVAITITAFDAVGNSGESSSQTITIVVDTNPPVFEEVMIWRSNTRFANLQSLEFLTDLEETDPNTNLVQNLDYYQNGAFWIRASVMDNETMINTNATRLMIFDAMNDNEHEYIFSGRQSGGDGFSPEWLITENLLISGGDARGLNYSGRIAGGERIYLRVTLTAQDMAENEAMYRDDFQYFILFPGADLPKATSSVGRFVVPRSSIPVDIFDDDSLDEVWVDLMTYDQFRSFALDGTERERELAIKTRVKDLVNKVPDTNPVWNFRGAPPHNPTTPEQISAAQFSNRRTGVSFPDQLSVNVQTGETDFDYGEYRLVAVIKDRKNPPHNTPDFPDTNAEAAWAVYSWSINISDNNAPLIVIDTVDVHAADYDPASHSGHEHHRNFCSLPCCYGKPHPPPCCHGKPYGVEGASSGNSPEENTFPTLFAEGTDPERRYFTINGFTLDEDSRGRGYVETFKIAWIPFNIPGGQESHVQAVRNAMSNGTPYPNGVQYWTLPDITGFDGTGPGFNGEKSYIIRGTEQGIAGIEYTKQTFKKRFDILGGQDDLKPEYRNFHYGCCTPANAAVCQELPENDPKLFVLFARDVDGKETFRTLRLLGNRAPPSIRVFDLTTKAAQLIPPLGLRTADNDPNNPIDWNESSIQADYSARIRQISRNNDDIMQPLMTYSRNTELALYVGIADLGDIPLKSLTMHDITSGNIEVGHYDPIYQDITFVKPLYDVLQRVFLIEAENKLGERASLQRTIAVTATALMTEISADKPSGIYKKDDSIILRAHFSNQVDVLTGTGGATPVMNIRYEIDSSYLTRPPFNTMPHVTYTSTGRTWVYTTVPLKEGQILPSMYLEFEFIIPEGASGKLETTDATNSNYPVAWGIPAAYRNPVYLRNNSRIVDFTRRDDAFIPGTAGIIWENGYNSLQGTTLNPRRSISLDGIPPVITQFSPGGKSVYPGENFMYFRNGEIITFTLLAQKPIFTYEVNPRIGFQVTDDLGYTSGTFYANYARPSGPYGMVFEIAVSNITLNNPSESGELLITSLYLDTALGNVVDHVQNTLIAGNLQQIYIDSTRGVRIDKKPPSPAPLLLTASNVENGQPHNPVSRYSENPVIQPIPNYTGNTELWGVDSQFSLTGFTWLDIDTSDPNYITNLTASQRSAMEDWIVGFREGDWKPGDPLQIKSNQWSLQTRRRDKAGNVSDPIVNNINIRSTFPRLAAIGARNADAIYTQGPITFTLDFDDRVVPTITNPSDLNRAYIVVANRSQPTAGLSDINQEFADRVYVDLVYECGDSSCLTVCTTPGHTDRKLRSSQTLTFTWNPITDKQMGNGLVVTRINLLGDIVCLYGNPGINSVTSPPVIAHNATPSDGFGTGRGRITMNDPSRSPSTYDVFNLNGAGLRIYTIPPELIASTPARGGVMEMGARDTITLIFNTDMRTESGTIIVRPRYTRDAANNYNWPIPPVFPAESHIADDGSWTPGLPEVFNAVTLYPPANYTPTVTGSAPATTNALRNALINPAGTAGTGFTSPRLNVRTGLPVGPYRLTTHGLTEGFGYTGSNTIGAQAADVTTGWSVDTGNTYMVPDISDKYVLAIYMPNANGSPNTAQTLAINSTTNTYVRDIRYALIAARYRWQEIDVISGVRIEAATLAELTALGENPTHYNPGNSRKVVIELEYPLATGMQWEVAWSPEALTSIAGLPATPADDWWFWTDGVQKPVIRVDRRSADYRTGANNSTPPWTLSILATLDNGYPGAAGFNNSDINSINFMVETETPGAFVNYATLSGVQSGATTGQFNNGAVTMAWGNTSVGTLPGGGNATQTWTTGFGLANEPTGGNTDPAHGGYWVLPNLVRRVATGRWSGTATSMALGNRYGVRYNVTEAYIENVGGVNHTRTFTTEYQGRGNLRLLRSYNRDALTSDLVTLAGSIPTPTAEAFQTARTFPAINQYTASKNYIAAVAHSTHSTVNGGLSAPGYEGVFRTVVAFYIPNTGSISAFGQNIFFVPNGFPIQIIGSNIQSPSPSIAGFPLMLGDADLRYLKVPQRVAGDRTQFLWVSTEIVSPMFLRLSTLDNNSAIMSRISSLFGDVGTFLTGGYGDLTYSYQQDLKTMADN
jgi:hypothetical protein